MSLVQYESSDESSDEEIVAPLKSISNETSSVSINSFLPPPKVSVSDVESKSQVLGKAIKNTVNAMIAHNRDGIVLAPSNRKVTSFVPSSVRSKVKTATEKKPQEQTKTLPMNLFKEVKPKNRSTLNHESIGIRSIEMTQDADEVMRLNESEPEPQEQVNIQEFNMDKFYNENIELKAKGELRENKRLYSVTNGKNQLSSLIKNAQQNEELLNEKFERNKKARKERESRYGF